MSVSALKTLLDFTLSNARRFYSSLGNPSDTEGLIKQQQHQQQRKRQLKINISEMVTILLILLIPRTFIADRARCKWVGRSAVEVNREFKKLRRQLQGKRHIKIELCVKLSLLRLFHVDHVVQNRRSALSLAWHEWFSCKGKE